MSYTKMTPKAATLRLMQLTKRLKKAIETRNKPQIKSFINEAKKIDLRIVDEEPKKEYQWLCDLSKDVIL